MTAVGRCLVHGVYCLTADAWHQHVAEFHTSTTGDMPCAMCGHSFTREAFPWHVCVSESLNAAGRARHVHPSLAATRDAPSRASRPVPAGGRLRAVPAPELPPATKGDVS